MQIHNHIKRPESRFSARGVRPCGIIFQRLMILFLLVSAPAYADVVESLYEVQIPVVDQNVRTRSAAFNQGLKEVFIRVTGDRNIFSLIKLPSASAYVKQFQYRDFEKADKARLSVTAEVSSSQDKPAPTQRLWVQFNETKVNDFVRNNALPLWGKHRNKTVIWLAVNDGANRYLLKRPDESLLKTAINDSATRRALPVAWPEVSREEQSIRFADVWAGFDQTMKKLSQNYSNGPILIGRLHWLDEQWSSQWSLFIDDSRTDWNIENAGYAALLSEAIDTAADTMGQKFALFDSGDSNSFHSLEIQVNAVDSIVALNDIKKYLTSVPMIQQQQLQRIEDKSVFFDISLRTNTDDLLEYLRKDAKLFLVPEDEKIKNVVTPPAEESLVKTAVPEGEPTKSDSTRGDLNQSAAVHTISKVAAYQFRFLP